MSWQASRLEPSELYSKGAADEGHPQGHDDDERDSGNDARLHHIAKGEVAFAKRQHDGGIHRGDVVACDHDGQRDGGNRGGHPEACAHGDENRQEDAEDGNADGAERVEQVQQGEHDAQGKDEVQAHDAAVGDESGKERGGAGVLDGARPWT